MMRAATGLLLASVSLAACVPSSTPPQPVPAPAPQAPRPAPVAPPAPVPPPVTGAAATAWMNAPLSSGDWTYRSGSSGQSRALFGPAGTPSFEVACLSGGVIRLVRSGGGAGPMTVRTTSTARNLAATASSAGLVTQLQAADPLLDAMAFSRGRFSVETPGTAPLIVPAWPELARVVEDCRR